MTTRMNPERKKSDPLRFFLRLKKRIVDLRPMVRVTPETNKILPMASKPLSKKKRIPKMEKSTPKAVRPIPIFFLSFISNEAAMLVR